MRYQLSKRHQDALDYALKQIHTSILAPYVEDIILFGSCAKGTATEDSDVDLFLQLCSNFPQEREYRTAIRLLKSHVTTNDINDPETDLKIVFGNEWKNNPMLFYENVRKEGVSLCH